MNVLPRRPFLILFFDVERRWRKEESSRTSWYSDTRESCVELLIVSEIHDWGSGIECRSVCRNVVIMSRLFYDVQLWSVIRIGFEMHMSWIGSSNDRPDQESRHSGAGSHYRESLTRICVYPRWLFLNGVRNLSDVSFICENRNSIDHHVFMSGRSETSCLSRVIRGDRVLCMSVYGHSVSWSLQVLNLRHEFIEFIRDYHLDISAFDNV